VKGLERKTTTGVFAGYFIAKGKAFARFRPGIGGSCEDCERRFFSYPDTCSEGWSRIREDRLEPCANWTARSDGT